MNPIARPCRWALLLVAICLPAAAAAQGVVRGRAVADTGGRPLADVDLILSPGKHHLTTGQAGTFRFPGLSAGEYQLVARRIGYRPVRLSITLKSDDSVDVLARLVPTAQVVDSLVVEGQAPSLSPSLRDMEERRQLGFGKFISASELRDLEGRRSLPELLRKWGVHIEWDRHGRLMAASTRGPTRFSLVACQLQIFQDGVPVLLDENHPFDLRAVPLSSLDGIEYYAGPAQTPVLFERENSSCGVLVLWTRER